MTNFIFAVSGKESYGKVLISNDGETTSVVELRSSGIARGAISGPTLQTVVFRKMLTPL